MPTTPAEVNEDVLTGVEEQIRDLQAGLQKQVEIATISAEIGQLQKLIGGFPLDAALNQGLQDVIDQVKDIQSGKKSLPDFGNVLVDLYTLQQSLENKLQEWLDKKQATTADQDKLAGGLLRVILQIRQLFKYRPDFRAVMDDLTCIKNFR